MIYVVDASVFNKLYLDEPDKDQVKAFFRHCGEHRVETIAPTLLLFETYRTALHFGLPVSVPLSVVEGLGGLGFSLVEPGPEVWEKAYEIASSGHPKSGYPDPEDSLYHALAVIQGGTFITADRRHVAKAKGFGHICVLADWSSPTNA